MTWLNWSLKFHSGLRTISHLILTHNTQDFDSMNAYLICVIVHVQMWCVCLSTWWSNPKRFLNVFFLKGFYTFVFLVFVQNAFLCFFFKNWFRGCFARSSLLRASCEMWLREIRSHIFHTETLATSSWVFCDYPLLTKWFLGKNWIFLKITQKLLRLSRYCLVT